MTELIAMYSRVKPNTLHITRQTADKIKILHDLRHAIHEAEPFINMDRSCKDVCIAIKEYFEYDKSQNHDPK